VAFRLALAYVVVVIRRLVRQAWTSTAGRSALAAAHDHRPPRRLRPRFGNQAGERGGAPLQRLVSASRKASRSALSTSSVPTTVPMSGSITGTIASDSVLAKAVS